MAGGIELSMSNIMQLMSALTPILISFFMLMLSFMNQNVKGIIFIAGVLLATFLNIPIKNMLKSESSASASTTCNIIDIPFLNRYNSPASSSLFIMFTFAYLFLPMRFNNQMNYAVIVALLSMYVVDSITRVNNSCTTIGGAVLGGLVGFIFGSLWYTLFHVVGADNLLYFDEVDSNAVRCERPSKQTFKCSVYKGGKLISESIA